MISSVTGPDLRDLMRGYRDFYGTTPVPADPSHLALALMEDPGRGPADRAAA